jgi:TRAP-type C4-dicarboxylate transport system substrate-binding protein
VKRRNLSRNVINVVLVLILMLTIGGCASKPASNQNGAVKPEGEKADQKAIEIKFSTWHVPASAECVDVWDPMLSELEARSNGRIKTTPYYGGALGAGVEHYDIVADGLSDMGYFTASWTPGLFPLSDVLSMPVFVGGKDVAVDIGNAMYEKILHQEYPDVKVLNLNGCVQSYFWTTKPVHTLEDVKGLKMRTPGGLQTYMIEALGAEPVFMPLGDVYLSMETGVIDGIVTCPQLYYAFNLHEVADYAVVASFGCVAEGVIMNQDSWERLPDDLKGIVEEVTENPFCLTGGLDVKAIDDIMKKLADAGVKFYELPTEEADRWNAIFTEKVVKKWVDQMEAVGLPGKETLLMYKEELDKHGVAFPAYPKDW